MKYQLLPPLTEVEYELLKNDIAQRGIQVPIEIDEQGEVLDGHHRLRAWQELRDAGIDMPQYPRVVRAFTNEQEKRNHVRVLNLARRQLKGEQRDKVIGDMRADGMTTTKIAEAIGVSDETVRRTIESVSTNVETGYVKGKDGKKYPAKKSPKVSVFAGDSRDEKRAIEAAQAIENAPSGKVVTANRATRLVREQKVKEQHMTVTALQENVLTDKAKLILGDFRIHGTEIADNSVDLILTDPPYPEEFLPLWSDLAMFAARVLKQDGLLTAYTGAMYLPEVIQRLGEKLQYWWTGSLVLNGPHSTVHARHIRQGSKPLLFYVKPGGKPCNWFEDTRESEGESKADHDWQQSIGAARYYIEALTNAGDLVIDPFLGSGTFGLAAVQAKRQFVGFEIEPAAMAKAIEKING